MALTAVKKKYDKATLASGTQSRLPVREADRQA